MTTPRSTTPAARVPTAAKDHSNEAGLAAIDEIARNSGPDARMLLLSGRSVLAPKDIQMLSRTSPEYQRHVLNRIQLWWSAARM